MRPDEPVTPPSESVARRFRNQRTGDTTPEVLLRSELHRRGLRFRLQRSVLPEVRRVHDIVFPRKRIIVDVHGCFWHGCPDHFVAPKTNSGFWREKLYENRTRDADTAERLAQAGWTYMIVWEHEPPEEAAGRIERAVRGSGSK